MATQKAKRAPRAATPAPAPVSPAPASDDGKVVRVPSDVYTELLIRQLATLKATGYRPTFGDVLREALGLRS